MRVEKKAATALEKYVKSPKFTGDWLELLSPEVRFARRTNSVNEIRKGIGLEAKIYLYDIILLIVREKKEVEKGLIAGKRGILEMLPVAQSAFEKVYQGRKESLTHRPD